MNWSTVFDESRRQPGASDADIERFLAAIAQPLSAAEIAEVNRSQQNPFDPGDPLHARYRPFDPSQWSMPDRPLPADYLSLLRWSNGGWCRTGEREFGFFPTDDPTGGVRAMTLAYHLPQYMPAAYPFALDGGGTFYLFDMRKAAKAGNYPVVCASSGALGWARDEHWVIAKSFEAACRGSSNVDELREGAATPVYEPTERVAVYLEQPLKSLKTLVLIKEQLGMATSIAELKRLAQSAPCPITDELTYMQAILRCEKVNAVEQCLGIRSLRDPSIRLPLRWQ